MQKSGLSHIIKTERGERKPPESLLNYLPYTRKGDGVTMLKLHTLAEWMHGFLDPERPYGLPEDVYNDVIPSGVHNFNRNDLF